MPVLPIMCKGKVVDAAGVGISGATVKIYSGTNVIATTSTVNAAGDYITSIVAGTYAAEASKTGYKTNKTANTVISATAVTFPTIVLSV